jgi:very-short-patch-repair endonuclease
MHKKDKCKCGRNKCVGSKQCQKCYTRGLKGKNHHMYIDGGWCGKHYCVEPNCNNEISYSNWKYGNRRCNSCAMKLKWKDNCYENKNIGKNNPMYGKHPSLKTRKLMSLIASRNWKNKELREKMIKASFKGRLLKPNVPEKKLFKLLNKLFDSEYKFVGDGKLFIDCLNPDFVNCNGQKKIIELYGDYWHKLPERIKTDKRRIRTYKKYGYSTLIVWEHELKDIDKLKGKLIEFNNK